MQQVVPHVFSCDRHFLVFLHMSYLSTFAICFGQFEMNTELFETLFINLNNAT